MARCTDCGAEIVWSQTGDTKKIALDAKPVKKGDPRFTGTNIWKVYALFPGGELGLARRGRAGDLRAFYTCHDETCTERKR